MDDKDVWTEEEKRIHKEFVKRLLSTQEPWHKEIAKIVNENFMELFDGGNGHSESD